MKNTWLSVFLLALIGWQLNIALVSNSDAMLRGVASSGASGAASITSGNIDGTTIGASVPSSGSFTNAVVNNGLGVTGGAVVDSFLDSGVANLAGALRISVETGITAFAGGGKGSATQLSATTATSIVAVVANPGDSVLLPSAAAANIGLTKFVRNSGFNPMQVFGSGTATIDGIGTGIGITQNPGSGVWYVVQSNNAWATTTFSQIITSSVASSGATVSLSTNTPTTVVSTGAVVNAGAWDVSGVVCYITQVNTSITVLAQGASTTTNTMGALGSYSSDQMAAMIPLVTSASEICKAVPPTRVNITSNGSNVYLVAKPVFTVGSLLGYGSMRLTPAFN